MKKISIIIPVYKVENYIERCLHSVLCQTYRNLEIILVDDCSPDKSMVKAMKVIEDFPKPPEIELIVKRHHQNQGLSAARNTGTINSHGDYLFYLDSDDELPSDGISKLMELANKFPDAELVQGKVESIPWKHYYDMSYYKDIVFIDNKEWITKNFFNIKNPFPINAWNKLLKKEFIINNQLFFKKGMIHEDELWMFQVVEKLNKIAFCHHTTYIHYTTPNSIMTSTKKESSANYWAIIFNEIKPYAEQNIKIKYEFYLKRFFPWYKDFHTLPSYNNLYSFFLKTSIKKGYFKYFLFLTLLRISIYVGKGKNYLSYLITK